MGLTQSISLESLKYQVKFKLAKNLIDRGMFNESLLMLSDCINNNPLNEEAIAYKGLVLMHMNRLEEALLCIEEALSIGPSNETCH